MVFNNNEQGITVTVSNLVATDTITIKYTVNGVDKGSVVTNLAETSQTFNVKEINANTYSVSLYEITDSNNYTLPDNLGTFTIAQKEIGFSWDYSGTAFVYDGNAHSVVATPTGLVDNATLTLAYSTNGTDGNSAVVPNNYTTTVTEIAGTGAQNYKLGAENTRSINWVIDKRTLSVEWSGSEFTYNGSSQGATVIIGDIVSEDVVGIIAKINEETPVSFVTTSYTFGKVHTGTYTATITGLDTANYSDSAYYKLPANVSYNFRIVQREIGITWATDTLATSTGNDKLAWNEFATTN